MSAYINVDDHFRTGLARDLAFMVLGDYKGAGTYRALFDHATDPTLVVKVETGTRSFSNVHEYEIWKAVQGTPWEKWFAPVVDISPAGMVLVMKRCEVATARCLPDKVPAFFTDLKAENWGFLDGRPVCLDYGNHLLYERGMTTRMRKARWS